MSLTEQLKGLQKREKTSNEKPSSQLLNLFSNFSKPVPSLINQDSSLDIDSPSKKTPESKKKITEKSKSEKSSKTEKSGNSENKNEGKKAKNSPQVTKKNNSKLEKSEKSDKSEKSVKKEKSEQTEQKKSKLEKTSEKLNNELGKSKKNKKDLKKVEKPEGSEVKSEKISESEKTGKSIETENEGTLEESGAETVEPEIETPMTNEMVSNILDTEEDKKLSEQERREKLSRTIFVGNLANSTTNRALTTLFSKYGKVESVRFRSVAVAKPTLPKKVSFITKQFSDKIDDIHAYVVFSTREEAREALDENAKIFKERHLRVDLASNEKGKLSNVNSVFVGNLPYDISDESLWQHFGASGAVTAVRVVRDPHFRIGRGIAYVMFSTPLAVRRALQLDQSELCGRKIRVSKVSKNATNNKKKQQLQKQNSDPKLTGAKRRRIYQGKEAVPGKKPRFLLGNSSSNGKPKSKSNKKNKNSKPNPNKNRKKV